MWVWDVSPGAKLRILPSPFPLLSKPGSLLLAPAGSPSGCLTSIPLAATSSSAPGLPPAPLPSLPTPSPRLLNPERCPTSLVLALAAAAGNRRREGSGSRDLPEPPAFPVRGRGRPSGRVGRGGGKKGGFVRRPAARRPLPSVLRAQPLPAPAQSPPQSRPRLQDQAVDLEQTPGGGGKLRGAAPPPQPRAARRQVSASAARSGRGKAAPTAARGPRPLSPPWPSEAPAHRTRQPPAPARGPLWARPERYGACCRRHLCRWPPIAACSLPGSPLESAG